MASIATFAGGQFLLASKRRIVDSGNFRSDEKRKLMRRLFVMRFGAVSFLFPLSGAAFYPLDHVPVEGPASILRCHLAISSPEK